MARNTEATADTEATDAPKATRVLQPRPVYMILTGDAEALETVHALYKAKKITVADTTRDNEAIVDAVSNGETIVFFKGMMK
jgi:hypothetical protein